MSKNITCNTSAMDEVDALKSRWQAAKNMADQWKVKTEGLVDSWNNFNLITNKIKKNGQIKKKK